MLNNQDIIQFIKQTLKFADRGRDMSPSEFQSSDLITESLPVIIKISSGDLQVV